ncbi:MAG: hypothetical protein HY658_07460 [Actinobacteria bacterium]|nr:hypothetical protein [Actinomycetota bacterium]
MSPRRMAGRRTLLVLLLIPLLVLPGPSGGALPEGRGARSGPFPDLPLYAPDGPFNTAIPLGVRLDGRSTAMVRTLIDDAARGGFFLLQKLWTTTVFEAGPGTPRKTVRLTAKWAPKRRIHGVPIPSEAVPDPSGDGSLAIIDPTTGCEYDFWQFEKRPRGYRASWGNALPLGSTGVFAKGLSARGSGFALPAGVIWPEELAAGRIEHALIFSYTWTSRQGAVPPATETDGWSSKVGAIPEGARVQLDPSLDLDRLPLSDHERTIARALQEYGMYLADTGGPGITLYAVNPLSFEDDAYAGLLPDTRYVSLDAIPVDRFRVLAMPEPVPASRLDVELVPTPCATFS